LSLIYFDSDRFYKVHSLFLAIEDAASGKTPFKHLENFIERVERVSSCWRIPLLCYFTHSQNLSGKPLSVEMYLILHRIRSTFFALAFIAGVLYVVFRIVGMPRAGDLRDVRTRFRWMPCLHSGNSGAPRITNGAKEIPDRY